ncbi:ras-specific guanine nucleotide-releasing factor 2-like isoform X3 [Lepeophtheirus salmonis]|uniref:ras-specific guanine nucleotide-releasing factor 2-like isoform X3 n=1 Tax=Lepeophtheirus salmonis TaxID=72036 RepID=UPI003AF36BAB
MSSLMMSPKMQRIQRTVRINDGQLLGLAEKARYDSRLAGFLFKRCSDSSKWLLRWFRLYQNLLFYYDNENTVKPIGVIFLEGCYCESRLVSLSSKTEDTGEKLYCFAIMYRRENQRQYELRADSINECKSWIDAIKAASFNKLRFQMGELEQKHLHLLQVVESEKTAKWQYTQHCEELTEEIKKLRNELFSLKKEWRLLPQMSKTSSQEGRSSGNSSVEEEDPDLAKIKKVQSFFRGWLCRRRWKQIVDEYIRSPHAESMRKRNCLVFRMVEAEEEYVEQMEILITCFYRPFKMAASSKNPPCTHDDINSIFLNSETVLFLHQIFLKGLTARMESWPTLVLGDLFDMLLPMLSIYQEYVRNHHYCLQVLTECKQSPSFAQLLNRLEKKPACKGRSLEIFLTYPMHQIPRYIITLHDLLAHTPPDHVEKKSLEHARDQLEDLSRQMHDEVSETENIRKNLAIERMIIEGCDILLDVNQVFVRQGTLIQILPSPSSSRPGRSRLNIGREKEREAVRQCFLFSNHLIMTTRTQAGRLHLVEGTGKIPLANVTLIEDPNEDDRNDDQEYPGSGGSLSDEGEGNTPNTGGKNNLNQNEKKDFKIIVDEYQSTQQINVHLICPTKQEKAAWITDISQCMDNVHFNGLFYNTLPNASSSTLPQCVKSDPSLFKDDVDIRFSKTFNTCKIPQIRYATPERLLQRLTDLRFLNIDFLNTFLLTYRVFTDSITVLEALKNVFNTSEPLESSSSSLSSIENLGEGHTQHVHHQVTSIPSTECEGKRRISTCSGYSTATANLPNVSHHPDTGTNSRHGSLTPRRISGASSVSGYCSDERGSFSTEGGLTPHMKPQHWRYSFRRYEEEQRETTLGVSSNLQNVEVLSRFGSGSGTGGRRKGSYDSICSGRSGSIVSTFRKESVPIIEQTEPISEMDDASSNGTSTTEKMEEEISISHSNVSKDTQSSSSSSSSSTATSSINTDNKSLVKVKSDTGTPYLAVPPHLAASSSAETLTDNTVTAPTSPTNMNTQIKNLTLKDDPKEKNVQKEVEEGQSSAKVSEKHHGHQPMKRQNSFEEPSKIADLAKTMVNMPKADITLKGIADKAVEEVGLVGLAHKFTRKTGIRTNTSSSSSGSYTTPYTFNLEEGEKDATVASSGGSTGGTSIPGSHHSSFSSTSTTRALFGGITFKDFKSPTREIRKKKGLFHNEFCNSGSSSISGPSGGTSQNPGSNTNTPISSPQHSSKIGVIITSSRQANRRSSSACASIAFAVATAGSGNPSNNRSPAKKSEDFKELSKRKGSMSSNATTMRVLSVLRHWVTKHPQDFEANPTLKSASIEFLDDINCIPSLLPAEHRASTQILRMLTKDESDKNKMNLEEILKGTETPSKETILSLLALEIAEQMTYLDQKILFAIPCSEFLGQAWTKKDRNIRAPNIVQMTKFFNDFSRLVCSEIISQTCLNSRIMVIEKWTAVADICRCLHNFNGVLQICAAFTNSSVFRLKNTWNRVSKSVRHTIDKLQSLVSSDGRFRNLRDTLHRTDPPCIPYLGMYLSDLTFIEEGTPNFTESGLLNFAKMRMIAHVIREIRQFQQTPYKIERIPKVVNYLLDSGKLMDDEEMYQRSLMVEPRASRLSSSFGHSMAVAAATVAARHSSAQQEKDSHGTTPN